MSDPYAVLEVARDATKADIERAYKKKARKTHPDTGGDVEQFKTISRAREILVSDERRKRFDETGDTSERPKTAASAAEAMVAGLVQEAFMQDTKPPIRWMCDVIDKKRFDIKRAVDQAKQQKANLTKKIDKFTDENRKTKNKHGMEFVSGILKAAMANLDNSIAGAERDIATCTEALTLLNDLKSSGGFERSRSPWGSGGMGTSPTTASWWIPQT